MSLVTVENCAYTLESVLDMVGSVSAVFLLVLAVVVDLILKY